MGITVSYNEQVIHEAGSTTNFTMNTAQKYMEGDIVVNATGDGGGSTLVTKTITQNGTYSAVDDSADGYSQVAVNVPSGGGMQYDTSAVSVDPSEYPHREPTASFTIGFTFESTAEVQ